MNSSGKRQFFCAAAIALVPLLGLIASTPLFAVLQSARHPAPYPGIPAFLPIALRYFPGTFFVLEMLCVLPLARLLVKRQAFSKMYTKIFLASWGVGLVFGAISVYSRFDFGGWRPAHPALLMPAGFAVSSTAVPLLLIAAAFLGSRPGKVRHAAWLCCMLMACIGALSCAAHIKRVQIEGPEVAKEALQVEDDPRRASLEPLVDEAPYWSSAAALADGPLPFQCSINRTPQVLRLALAGVEYSAPGEKETLHPSYRAAFSGEQYPDFPLLPSVQMLHFRNKALSDDLLGALERHLQLDSAALGGGKASVFTKLFHAARRTDGGEAAAIYLATGLSLSGGLPEEIPEEIASKVDETRGQFLAQPEKSRPLGFYAEHEDLRRIFRQDRFFQGPLSTEDAAALASGLLADPALRSYYETVISLQRILNNPPANYSVGEILVYPELLDTPSELLAALYASETGRRLERDYPARPKTIALIPHATSRENEFFERHFLDGLPSENIMNRFIAELRTGTIDLTPREGSGWYDYKSYALAPLVLPESAQEHAKLVLNAEYKKHLIEAFKTMITQNRETHIKAIPPSFTLGDHIGGPAPRKRTCLTIAPDLSIEPTATYYLRMARAFRFVQDSLVDVLGESELASIPMPEHENVGQALRDATMMNYGWYLEACSDLGLEPALAPDELPDPERARARAMYGDWRQHLKDDPYLARDVRNPVPVLASPIEGRARYWASLGIRMRQVYVQFEQFPALRFQDTDSGALLHKSALRLAKDSAAWKETFAFLAENDVVLAVEHRAYSIPVEVFAEFDGPLEPYTRAEFQRLCDTYQTQKAIMKAILEGRRATSGWAPAVVVAAALCIVLAIVWRARRRAPT